MKAKKVIAMLLAATLSVTAFTGCAINKTATVATLDKEDIKLGLVNFMIRYQEAGYDDMYIQYMGEGYWDKTVSGNNTVLETWKKNAIEEAHELYTLKAHQSDYDVEVSDDEKKEIKKAAEKFMKANSDDVIDEMSATEEIVEEYLELRLIKSKMYAAIIKNADSSVTDEEANMAAYTVVKLDYKGAYDSNYQYQTYTDEQSAQIKAQALQPQQAHTPHTLIRMRRRQMIQIRNQMTQSLQRAQSHRTARQRTVYTLQTILIRAL